MVEGTDSEHDCQDSVVDHVVAVVVVVVIVVVEDDHLVLDLPSVMGHSVAMVLMVLSTEIAEH